MLLARCKLNSFFPVFLKQLLECSWSHIPPANICLWPKFVVFSWLSYLGPIEGFSLYQIRAWYYIFLSNPNAFKSLLQFVYLITDILVIKVQFNSTEKSHSTAARSEIKSVITTNRYGCFIFILLCDWPVSPLFWKICSSSKFEGWVWKGADSSASDWGSLCSTIIVNLFFRCRSLLRLWCRLRWRAAPRSLTSITLASRRTWRSPLSSTWRPAYLPWATPSVSPSRIGPSSLALADIFLSESPRYSLKAFLQRSIIYLQCFYYCPPWSDTLTSRRSVPSLHLRTCWTDLRTWCVTWWTECSNLPPQSCSTTSTLYVTSDSFVLLRHFSNYSGAFDLITFTCGSKVDILFGDYGFSRTSNPRRGRSRGWTTAKPSSGSESMTSRRTTAPTTSSERWRLNTAHHSAAQLIL